MVDVVLMVSIWYTSPSWSRASDCDSDTVSDTSRVRIPSCTHLSSLKYFSWIYNEELRQNKKIKKEELNNYLNQNWKKGSKQKYNNRSLISIMELSYRRSVCAPEEGEVSVQLGEVPQISQKLRSEHLTVNQKEVGAVPT